MSVYNDRRRAMVQGQIARRGLCDPRLLAAFNAVPRHLFVPFAVRHLAYQDRSLPIGYGQTISQPYIVAFMTDVLHLRSSERVLEVGTGSGYQAAILSRLVTEVYTVELDPALSRRAQGLLCLLECVNVHCFRGDGSLGWPDAAPYGGILVTAGAPGVPPPLLDQLADGGRLVIPVGEDCPQLLELWTRSGQVFHCEKLLQVGFVPLRGEFGHKD